MKFRTLIVKTTIMCCRYDGCPGSVRVVNVKPSSSTSSGRMDVGYSSIHSTFLPLTGKLTAPNT